MSIAEMLSPWDETPHMISAMPAQLGATARGLVARAEREMVAQKFLAAADFYQRALATQTPNSGIRRRLVLALLQGGRLDLAEQF